MTTNSNKSSGEQDTPAKASPMTPTNSEDSSTDPKYEFNRGWEGGYRQGLRDAKKLLWQKGQASKQFQDDTVMFKIPRENIKKIDAELDKELKYP